MSDILFILIEIKAYFFYPTKPALLGKKTCQRNEGKTAGRINPSSILNYLFNLL